MIEIKNLNYQIEQTPILQEINLSLPDHALIALIGPNGAGKSTLLSLIARLIPLQTGEIFIDGKNLRTTATREMAKHLAIFQQHTQLMSRLRVNELLLMARFPYHRGFPKAQDKAICNAMIARFHLENIAHRFLDTLSGGQRQRALAAMVFAQDTPNILLDEPLNNLDMRHARDLMNILRDAVDKHQKRVLLVLHDVNYAAKYADYIVALKDGRIHWHGATKDILNSENLSKLYQIPVYTTDHEQQRFCIYY